MDAWPNGLWRLDRWAVEQQRIENLKVSESEKDAFYQAMAYNRFTAEQYDHRKFQWSAEPPNAQCERCYEWKRYPLGQRHFGYAWWRKCSHRCECAHHASEVWMA